MPSSSAITSTLILTLIPLVGSQLILSTILAIQNNNHTQEHEIYEENPFSLKEKIMGQTLNRFTIIKSITIILMYVPRLKKNLSYFSLLTHTHTHTHTNYLSQRQQHFTLSFLFSSAHTTFSWLSFLSISGFLLAALSSICDTFFLLLSHSSCISPKQKSFFWLLVSRFIFSLHIGRTLLGQNRQIFCSIVYL